MNKKNLLFPRFQISLSNLFISQKVSFFELNSFPIVVGHYTYEETRANEPITVSTANRLINLKQ